MQDQRDCDHKSARQQHKIDEVLAFIGQRALRQNFLQLTGGHQTSGKGEAAENHFEREDRHHEAGNIG